MANETRAQLMEILNARSRTVGLFTAEVQALPAALGDMVRVLATPGSSDEQRRAALVAFADPLTRLREKLEDIEAFYRELMAAAGFEVEP
ncbi:MAG TPA: hypothetical protein VGB99_04550 [Acidobacteriota bacterium]